MKMAACLSATALVLALAGSANADVSLSFVPQGGTSVIPPGGSITWDLTMTITNPSGVTYGGGVFNLTVPAGLGTLGSLTYAAGFSESIPLPGGFSFFNAGGYGTGTYTIGSLTFTAGALEGVGTLGINFQSGNPSQLFQGINCPEQPMVSPATFSVAVPTPGTAGLLGLGGFVAIRRRRR